jgi:hypothetical protein
MSEAWKLLYRRSAVTDDTSAAVATQTWPTSGTGRLVDRRREVPLKTELLIIWLTSAGAPISDASRGSVSVTVFRRVKLTDENSIGAITGLSASASITRVTDGATLAAQRADTPIVMDEVRPGDDYYVQLTTFASLPATAAGYAVFVRESI